jgi:mediator of RNA polymerase II transcription subunit 13
MKTPSSHSAPVTPAVLVDTLEHLRRPGSVYGPSIFEPIAFAPSHKMADEKYVFGKFALPSPPDEEDRTEALALPYFKGNGWKTRYNAITDPRISVVRKLIGAKRKIVEQGGRDGKVSPSWVRDQEEWQSSVIHTPENDKSDVDSEEEEDTVDEEDVIPRTGSDRPSTPLPSYLPVGPSLLATQFHHAHLLSISTSLKPPGAAVAPTNLGTTVAPISVPTPVSPPAMLGEKSRSLEAAANMLAQEVVENSVWADSWRLNLLGSSFTFKPLICQADVKRTARLFDQLECLTCPVEMGLLYDSGQCAISDLDLQLY